MKNRTSTAYGVYLSPPATLSFVQNGHPWPFCKRHCWQSQQCLQNCFAILGVHPCTPTRHNCMRLWCGTTPLQTLRVCLVLPATLFFVQNGHPWPFCKRHCWQSQQCLQNCFAILGVHPVPPTRHNCPRLLDGAGTLTRAYGTYYML